MFCGRLLYPEKAKWIAYDRSFRYPIKCIYPTYNMQLHSQLPERIPCCSSCVSPHKRLPFPRLTAIPDVINTVPFHKRKYLSPIFLQSSLGRAVDGNAYSTYRHIVGTMGYSRNIRCLTLYSGMIGAFLEAQNTHQVNDAWFHPSLLPAARWLRENNPYIAAYGDILQQYVDANNLECCPHPLWPTAEHMPQDATAPPVIRGDVVVPNYDFPNEVHNEDSHYSRLMAGFLRITDNNHIPISFASPDLEALIFPDLFPDGHGHFKDSSLSPDANLTNTSETYGKYIKHRLQGIDPRFRLHPTWPVWSYLQLEKLRNYQNTARLLRTKNAEESSLPRTAAQILQQSLYRNASIIDEEKSVPLPTFIRTGSSYFREKQFHLDTMISSYNLPTLFITLTMAESKWTQLADILSVTDNGDTIPSNRPYHTTLHFINRLQMLKSHVWKNASLAEWGHIENFFERTEFQNRGAAHIHGCYWTTLSLPQLLAKRLIRSDLPDAQLEPELYRAVVTHQIHTCTPTQCGGPAPSTGRCKKGFPRPFSASTYQDGDSLRYVYECRSTADQYVVPYHPATLLAWNAHINVQYITTKGFARYMVKYINKPEPSHVFNIYDGDSFRQHVIARRLGTMEVMFLTLGETICNSSTSVIYLTTEPPDTRPKAIKPVHLLEHDDNHPFWNDTINKYFSRPHIPMFESLTYEEYFRRYTIASTCSTRNQFWMDDLGNYVTARKEEILIRFRHIRIAEGDPYFYQLLLRSHPWRSESAIRGNHATYRDHYLTLHPEETEAMRNELTTYLAQRSAERFSHFEDLINSLFTRLNTLPTSISDIIRLQMTILYRTPPIIPQSTISDLPSDQYAALDCLTNKFGPLTRTKYPYYFLTGAAGTGKSHVAYLFVQFLQQKNLPYLLMAPTGVAAQNVGGKTIHSSLRICQSDGHYKTLALYDPQFRHELLKIRCIIIDEISMVSAAMLDFISNTFAQLHANNMAFGNLPTLLIGDLHQLPPVDGSLVFRAASWKVFQPLFLTQSQRQKSDPTFYSLLNEVRTGNISQSTWDTLYQRYKSTFNSTQPQDILSTTYIVGTRSSAQSINTTICNNLPTQDDQFLISSAHDVIRNTVWEDGTAERLFKSKTNLPQEVRLQPGARVMLLNNDYFDRGLCNGSIGFVTNIDISTPLVNVAFHVSPHGNSEILHLSIPRTTASFYVDGAHASRTQFPLQNSFALTVHKSQSLTLPKIDIHLDDQFFAPGHAYTAISRASSWDDIRISDLNPSAFRVDPAVIDEYARLTELHQKMSSHINNYGTDY